MEKKVALKIDGKDVEATAGQTVLECARDNGIFIPTLCHYAKTTNVGACRVCVVEQEGARSSCRFLLHAGKSQHGYSHQYPGGARRSEDDY